MPLGGSERSRRPSQPDTASRDSGGCSSSLALQVADSGSRARRAPFEFELRVISLSPSPSPSPSSARVTESYLTSVPRSLSDGDGADFGRVKRCRCHWSVRVCYFRSKVDSERHCQPECQCQCQCSGTPSHAEVGPELELKTRASSSSSQVSLSL
eukprot:737761-Rhodomonas_salina.1